MAQLCEDGNEPPCFLKAIIGQFLHGGKIDNVSNLITRIFNKPDKGIRKHYVRSSDRGQWIEGSLQFAMEHVRTGAIKESSKGKERNMHHRAERRRRKHTRQQPRMHLLSAWSVGQSGMLDTLYLKCYLAILGHHSLLEVNDGLGGYFRHRLLAECGVHKWRGNTLKYKVSNMPGCPTDPNLPYVKKQT
ncbi:hypothetical protein ANN_06089 [Periplaneta americana]|uniref:Uncharacterized protein n=1 Tax=Periplaneta americana TaxID=6978 RepID=A0ABQ8TCK7_PERAM|nr:hypothetical protein ANN_06089 [Periplaneta americana]